MKIKDDCDREVAVNSLKKYLQFLLSEMNDDIGENGRQKPSTTSPDTYIQALLADYETATQTIESINDNKVLDRSKRIALKESLNRYLNEMIETQIDIERGGQSSYDTRCNFINEMNVADRLLESVLVSLDRDVIIMNVVSFDH